MDADPEALVPLILMHSLMLTSALVLADSDAPVDADQSALKLADSDEFVDVDSEACVDRW